MGVDIKRKDLYEKVWSTPLSELAKEFGVSDQAVGKACKRANIPKPGRGYWAKRDAGKMPPKPPLPPRFPGDEGIVYIGQYETHRRTEDEIISESPILPAYYESLDEMRERVAQLIGKVAYPPLKTKTHPIILNFLSQDEERKSEHEKNPFDWNKPVFDAPIEKRRLRILNAIFLSSTRLGCSPSMTTSRYQHNNRTASIIIGTQSVQFELREVAPTGRMKKADTQKLSRLELNISRYAQEAGLPSHWEDTEGSTLESHLTEILIELIIAAELQLRALVQQQYDWQIKYRAELIERKRLALLEHQRIQQETIEQAKQTKIRKLLADAQSLHQAETIRAYVAKVQEQKSGDVQISEWAEWALGVADNLDPVLNCSNMFMVSNSEDCPQ